MFTKTSTLFVVRYVLILVLLGGVCSVSPLQTESAVYALGETGVLDTTFGDGGLVTTDVSYGDEGGAVVVQPDGKIVVGGKSHSDSSIDFMLTRYNSNGSLDTDFDIDGKVMTDIKGQQDYASAIALQVDGKIVAAGYSEFNMGGESEFALVRYNSDGSLDTAFDLDGKVTTNLGSTYEFLSAMTIQADGKIIVVGSKNIGINDDDIVVVRYNPDGSLDVTFDTDGIVSTAIGSGYETAMSVIVQPDGKLLVGGVTYNGSNMDWALLRYNSDGTLDTSFDGDGIVTKNFGIGFGRERGGYIALQPNGKILISGDNGEGYFFLARYNNDGSPDITFDSDGFVATVFSGSSYDQVEDIALQQNGKIILAGTTCFAFGSKSCDFALARYNSNGSLDTSLGSDGKVVTDFLGSNQDDLGNAVAIQPDGKIVVAGYSYVGGFDWDVAVARYIGTYKSKSIIPIDIQDGWILESSETSNKGGSVNTTAQLLYVGDNVQDKQYRSILSFDTSVLPESAIIKSVKLKIKVQGFVGGNMFTPVKTLGNLLIDISEPGFGGNVNLAVADFQSAASVSSVGVLGSASTGWKTITLKSAAFDFVNLTGKTQLRLRFQKDDNDDLSADYLKIYSGEAPAASRPQLIVEYYIP